MKGVKEDPRISRDERRAMLCVHILPFAQKTVVIVELPGRTDIGISELEGPMEII